MSASLSAAGLPDDVRSGSVGFALLELLELAGWDVVVTARFAGGPLVLAEKFPGFELRSTADEFAAAALEVFEQACRLSRVQGQLPLPLDCG